MADDNFEFGKPGSVYICFGSGKKYYHQYGGTACYHATVKNPVLLGVSDSKFFSPKWWYSLSYFGIDWASKDSQPDFVVPKFRHSPIRFDLPADKFLSQLSGDQKRAERSRTRIDWDRLGWILEFHLSRLNPSYTEFEIEKVNDRRAFAEAYLPVKFTYQHKRKKGYVIWENCD